MFIVAYLQSLNMNNMGYILSKTLDTQLSISRWAPKAFLFKNSIEDMFLHPQQCDMIYNCGLKGSLDMINNQSRCQTNSIDMLSWFKLWLEPWEVVIWYLDDCEKSILNREKHILEKCILSIIMTAKFNKNLRKKLLGLWKDQWSCLWDWMLGNKVLK